MNKNLMIVIAALLVIFGLVMSGYNNLVGMNENINGKWSQIENQLQRRNDLIPNLVNTVKVMLHTKAMCLKLLPTRAPNLAEPKPCRKQARLTANFPAH